MARERHRAEVRSACQRLPGPRDQARSPSAAQGLLRPRAPSSTGWWRAARCRSLPWWRRPDTGSRPSSRNGPESDPRPSPGCRSTSATTIRPFCLPTLHSRSAGPPHSALRSTKPWPRRALQSGQWPCLVSVPLSRPQRPTVRPGPGRRGPAYRVGSGRHLVALASHLRGGSQFVLAGTDAGSPADAQDPRRRARGP